METRAMVAGRFRIEGKIGEGASAIVYAARDVVLDREVALKVPRLALGADPEAAQRVAAEAAAAARLCDAHVVTIYDVVEDAGRPVIVMERVPGRSLADLLRERETLPLEEALRIAEGVARALAHAHRAGVIHRDVKPSNVLLDGEGGVKLTDFGIARALTLEQARLTQTGFVLGSVHYLAPELVDGGEPSAASDLYALGALTYQMLCGRPPYTADDPIAIALAHRMRPVPRPSAPAGLADVIESLLAKDPSRRPSAAAEIADALAAWRATLAASDPLAAPTVKVGTRPRARRQVAPRTLGAVALLVVLAVLVSLLARRPHDVLIPDARSGVGDAAAAAQRLGLRVQRIARSSRAVPKGALIRQYPAAGTRVAPGTDLRLIVSSGTPLVVVPDARGMNVFAAMQAISEKGLQPATQPRGSDAPPTQVIGQSPPPGSSVEPHSWVVLVVSTGTGDQGPSQDGQ